MRHLIIDNMLKFFRSYTLKHQLTFLLASFFVLTIYSQSSNYNAAKKLLEERGEVYFSFDRSSAESQKEFLRSIISIDNVSNETVWAYANQNSFDQFVALGISYQVLTPPSMEFMPGMVGKESWRTQNDWDFYPTYEAYVEIMNQFVTDYPDLCELESIKTLDSGREILMLHINDSLGVEQSEPEFLYTSSIHGDETAGYVMMLHFIDHLLSNYNVDNRITGLVKNIDIWINPLANPDGTYAGGNNTVFGAKRFNANNVDLNRNYPDPEDGPNPDGNAHQPETIAFMEFADEHDFVMSANMHGGAEVCNYPWDTWSKRHADTDWWEFVCREYADTAHVYGPSGYLTDLDNGVTNGYDWYSINGGRQDYMTYFHHGRELTLELSSQKLIPENQFLTFWESNYRSLLNYMEQLVYGIRGIVSSTQSGNPLAAKVFIADHDKDQSYVFAAENLGDYYRLLKSGSYDITFSHEGFESKTFSDVTVTDYETLYLNVSLDSSVGIFETKNNTYRCYPNPVSDLLYIESDLEIDELSILSSSGATVLNQIIDDHKAEINISDLPGGIYYIKISRKENLFIEKMIKY